MATKKTAQKKTTVKKPRAYAKSTSVKSFHVAPRQQDFWALNFTQQSLYWVIIGAAVLAVAIYVATLQIKINELYDQVDANSLQSELNRDELKKLNEAIHGNTTNN